VLFRFQGLLRLLVVQAVRRGDVDGLHAIVGEEAVEGGVGVVAFVLGAEGLGLVF